MTRKITARGIVLHDGKLLCARLKPYKDARTQANDYWCIPGGGLEANESLSQCIKREMIEETGIKPAVGRLLYVQQYTANNREYVEFFFHITNSQDYLEIDLTKASHGEEEIEEIGFVDPVSTYILPTFLSSDNIAAHVGSNADTKLFSFL